MKQRERLAKACGRCEVKEGKLKEAANLEQGQVTCVGLVDHSFCVVFDIY
jgi:hypothetical protein